MISYDYSRSWFTVDPQLSVTVVWLYVAYSYISLYYIFPSQDNYLNECELHSYIK